MATALQGSALTVLQIDTERGWRGGQRQTLLVARELARLGHRSLVAARAGEPLAERAAAIGLQVIPVSPRSEFAVATAVRLRRVIISQGVQIVHAQAAHALTLAALATLGTPARVVVTRHLARALRNNAGTRWKYGRASATIAVSQAAANTLVASGISRNSIEVVHGGVDVDREVTAATPEVLATVGVPRGALLAVMVGALVPQKDPLTFVRAIAAARRAVHDLHALIVGEGELRGAVTREAAALGVAEFVHLSGFRTDVDSLLAAADVAVLSSRFEGLPLVLMDAFALSRAVVATDGPGVNELVISGETGLLVPVGDHAALGAAIARVVLDDELRARLAAGGRARAAEFSIQRTVARTLAVYRRVLGRGQSRSDSDPD